MKQKRRVNNATKSESIRDKNNDVNENRTNVTNKTKIPTINTLLGGTRIINTDKVRQSGVKISIFLDLFIFFQLNLSLQ